LSGAGCRDFVDAELSSGFREDGEFINEISSASLGKRIAGISINPAKGEPREGELWILIGANEVDK
jgi:hypothetical protein